MAGNKFNRYLWLINLLRTEGPIPFRKISEKWRHSSYNDEPGKALPLKTFHNHCGVIAEIFGVDVECEKGGNYGYYIPEAAESEEWKLNLLDQLLTSNAISEDPSLGKRILLLDRETKHFPLTVLDALKNHSLLSFERPNNENYRTFFSYASKKGMSISDEEYRKKHWIKYENYCPTGIFRAAQEWWMVGFFKEDGIPAEECRISPFSLRVPYTTHITVTGTVDDKDYPNGFSLEKFISGFREKHKGGFVKEDDFQDGRKRLYLALKENDFIQGRGTALPAEFKSGEALPR